MAKVSKQSNWSRILYSKITLFVLAAIVIIFAYNLVGLIVKSRATAQRRAEAIEQEQSLQKRHDELAASIAMLQTEEGKEQALRDKFGVVKEGEKAIVFIDSSKSAPQPVVEEENFFQRLWHKIFKKN